MHCIIITLWDRFLLIGIGEKSCILTRMEIEYSDGLEIEERIERLLGEADDLSALNPIHRSHYGEWPIRYHLSPERANLLRHLSFSGLDVLELGAGMGAISRFLAERAKSLTVIEGTEQRFRALCERLRDLDNWTGVVANVADANFEKKFDVVCVIGVLEYSQMYVVPKTAGQTPFEAFLEKAKSFLKDDGVLVLAIENQLGLKYWNGIPEDHTNRLFDGIAGYPLSPSPKTFSRKALKALLEHSGFSQIQEYFPFPDYKVPSCVVNAYGAQAFPELSADLACHRGAESYSGSEFPLYPEVLATHTVAKAGLLPEFSNSFLCVAGKNPDSPLLGRLCPKDGSFAWHYSVNRQFPTQTVFRQNAGRITVEKTNLAGAPSDLTSPSLHLTWSGKTSQPLETGERLRLRLLQRAHFEGLGKLLLDLGEFIRWSFQNWKTESDLLAEESLDAVYANALLSPTDGIQPFAYRLFDLEWKARGGVEKSWFILRNILLLQKDFPLLRAENGLGSLEDLYEALCKAVGVAPELERAIRLEAELQSLVTPESSVDAFRGALRHFLERPFKTDHFLRDPKEEQNLRKQALVLKTKAPLLLSAFDRRLPRLFFKGEAFLRNSSVMRKFSTYTVSLLRALYRYLPTLYRKAELDGEKNKKTTPLLSRRFGALPKTGWVHARAVLSAGAGALTDVTLVLHSRGTEQKVLLSRRWLGSFSRVLKLTRSVDAVSIEILSALPNANAVHLQTRKLSKIEAALRLVLPQLPAIWKDRAKRTAFFARARDLWKQGKVRGLLAFTQQQAFMGDVGFVEDYSAWIEEFESLSARDVQEIQTHLQNMAYRPLISIILPVYNPKPRWLRAALDSVLAQTYPNWELCIADDASTNPVIAEILEEYRLKDGRVHVVYRSKNGHIAQASNSALAISSGEFVALLDHDDLLSPLALYFVVQELNQDPNLQFIYTDEDKMDHRERRFLPHFKPDWNEELFYSYNVFTHLSVLRTSGVKKLGGFRAGFEGAQDYDLFLRYLQTISPETIRHIPRVLYHWRAVENSTSLGATAKPYAFGAAQRALAEHFERTGVRATVEKGFNDTHRISYALPETLPKVSVIICTRDRGDLVRAIIDDLTTKTLYANLEIILIDNQSTDKASLQYFEDLGKKANCQVLRYNEPFNFSAMNNLGVRHASGEFVLLLNNDVRTRHPEWLKEMVRLGLRPNTGAVGAKLFYPSERIQHAGVILGIGGVAGHSHKGFARHAVDFYARTNVPQWISAVTGACLLVRKDLYEKVGGLDAENLTVAFNDVDFCLKLRESGYHNIYAPTVELTHLESESRGSDQRPETFPRFQREEAFMKKKWGKLLKTDPFYSPNLTLSAENFSLAFPPRMHKPWREHAKAKRKTTHSISALITESGASLPL